MLVQRFNEISELHKIAGICNITFTCNCRPGMYGPSIPCGMSFAVMVEFIDEDGCSGIVNLLDTAEDFSDKEKYDALCQDFRNLAAHLSSEIMCASAPNAVMQQFFGPTYYLRRAS